MYYLEDRTIRDENGLVVAEVRAIEHAHEIVAALNVVERAHEVFPGLVDGCTPVNGADLVELFSNCLTFDPAGRFCQAS